MAFWVCVSGSPDSQNNNTCWSRCAYAQWEREAQISLHPLKRCCFGLHTSPLSECSCLLQGIRWLLRPSGELLTLSYTPFDQQPYAAGFAAWMQQQARTGGVKDASHLGCHVLIYGATPSQLEVGAHPPNSNSATGHKYVMSVLHARPGQSRVEFKLHGTGLELCIKLWHSQRLHALTRSKRVSGSYFLHPLGAP